MEVLPNRSDWRANTDDHNFPALDGLQQGSNSVNYTSSFRLNRACLSSTLSLVALEYHCTERSSGRRGCSGEETTGAESLHTPQLLEFRRTIYGLRHYRASHVVVVPERTANSGND